MTVLKRAPADARRGRSSPRYEAGASDRSVVAARQSGAEWGGQRALCLGCESESPLEPKSEYECPSRARADEHVQMGDFNSQPFSVPIAIMRSHGELSDSFVDAHPYANTSSGRPVSPENGVTLHGMTCDSPLNTYSHGKPIPAEITSKGGKRLDYIFYRQPEVARRRPLIWGYRDEGGDGNIGAGAGAGIRDGLDGALEQGKPLPHSLQRAPVLRCAKSEVVLTGRVPGKSFSYSDHFGLSSTFVVDSPASSRSGAGTSGNPTESEPSRHSTESSADKNSFTPLVPLISEPEAINPTTTTFALPELPRSPPTSPRASSSLPHAPKSSILRTALATLRDYTAISRRNRLLHLRLSAAAVVILLGLTIGSAWQPKSYIQPIFTLLAAVLGGAGATFFYLGFLWGKWEEGLLTEVREEMELELRVVEVEERATRSA